MESLKNKIEYKTTNFNRVDEIYTRMITNRENLKLLIQNDVTRKNKKIFLDSSPHDEPAQKGEGASSQKVGRIYSAGKYPVFAICVRTQINVCIT